MLLLPTLFGGGLIAYAAVEFAESIVGRSAKVGSVDFELGHGFASIVAPLALVDIVCGTIAHTQHSVHKHHNHNHKRYVSFGSDRSFKMQRKQSTSLGL